MEWACDRCGRCCKSWEIPLDDRDIEKIEKAGYGRRQFVLEKPPKKYLKKRFGSCVFLGSGNDCLLQEHGSECKPKVCREFPFVGNANQMVCGRFTGTGNLGKARPDTSRAFEIGGKAVPAEVFLYVIGKLGHGDYAAGLGRIISGISGLESNCAGKDDIDRILKSGRKDRISSFRMKSALAFCSSHYLYGLLMLYAKRPLVLNLPTGRYMFRNPEGISVSPSGIYMFLKVLEEGHGIIFRPRFPYHLLFSLYFLEDFARSEARKRGAGAAGMADIANAYCRLNGIFRFR